VKRKKTQQRLKHMIVRMINEMKEDMYKKMNEFKEDTNKQVNKIRKIVQVMKKEFKKR
jgi:hypothetical protein